MSGLLEMDVVGMNLALPCCTSVGAMSRLLLAASAA